LTRQEKAEVQKENVKSKEKRRQKGLFSRNKPSTFNLIYILIF